MKKTAFIFPGQASQYVGMAGDLYSEYERVKDLFSAASGILGYDLADVCFNGPEEKLKQTSYTQPAVLVHSLALNMILDENGISPDAAAGHSLGEYSALVCAGALDTDTAIRAVARRSRAMQDDCDRVPGAMAAVLGLDYDKVVEILKSAPGIAVPANYNSPGQTVIAGEVEAVNHACKLLKDNGAKRAMPIPVGGAYHSPLMAESAAIVRKFIFEELGLSGFKFPVYSNVNARPADDPSEFRSLLAEQIPSPVLWYPILRNMYDDGISRFVEIGPGNVLQGLAKRSLNDDNMEIMGIDTLEDLREFLENSVGVRSI
jgi:[acyl-carrier-protein] S-malonyltransferase